MSKRNRKHNRNNNQTNEEVDVMSDKEAKELTGPEVVKKEASVPEAPKKQEPVKQEPVKQQEVKPQLTPTTVTTVTKTDSLTNVERMLLDYVNKRQEDISDEELGKVQLGLIRLIRTILGRQDNEQFRKEWNSLLVMARKNKDNIFNVNDFFVAVPSIPGSEQEITLFRHLGWIILRSLNPNKIKEEMKSIDVSKVISNLNPIEARNFVSFYE